MMINLEIEVFWHTDQTKQLNDLDIDFNLEDCETRIITIYNINAISPYVGAKNEYCNIHVGDDQWLATKSYKEIKGLIDTLLLKAVEYNCPTCGHSPCMCRTPFGHF